MLKENALPAVRGRLVIERMTSRENVQNLGIFPYMAKETLQK